MPKSSVSAAQAHAQSCKAWRDAKDEKAHAAACASKKSVLASITWFGTSTCNSIVPSTHPLVSKVANRQVIDAYTGHELCGLLGAEGKTLSEVMGSKGTVPTTLCMFYEAMRFELRFGKHLLHFDPERDLHVCSPKSLWKIIADDDWLLKHHVAVVILPPFSTHEEDDPQRTIALLNIAIARAGIATIPSIPEYIRVSLKDVQMSALTRVGIPHVPTKVFEVPANADPISIKETLLDLIPDLDAVVAGSTTAEFAANNRFLAKPAVGECGDGHVRFALADRGGRGSFGHGSRKRPRSGDGRGPGGSDEDLDMEAACKVLAARACERGAPEKWILQKWYPGYPLSEFKVWVSGVGKTSGRVERSDDRVACIAYFPTYKSGAHSVVYCKSGSVYSELFGPDNQPLGEGLLVDMERGDGRGNKLLQTYPNSPMHSAIDSFARRAAVAWYSQPGMDVARDVGARFDVVAFVRRVETAGVPYYDTANPTIVLGELDMIGAGAPNLDLWCPARDDLWRQAPPGFMADVLGGQHPSQRTMVHALAMKIVEKMYVPAISERGKVVMT